MRFRELSACDCGFPADEEKVRLVETTFGIDQEKHFGCFSLFAILCFFVVGGWFSSGCGQSATDKSYMTENNDTDFGELREIGSGAGWTSVVSFQFQQSATKELFVYVQNPEGVTAEHRAAFREFKERYAEV